MLYDTFIYAIEQFGYIIYNDVWKLLWLTFVLIAVAAILRFTYT
ncbi:hypothetical protein [Paenibacillus sp. MSJ-34]|nr:hypothetical protein [Paenibacillus sp. MSJ-34]